MIKKGRVALVFCVNLCFAGADVYIAPFIENPKDGLMKKTRVDVLKRVGLSYCLKRDIEGDFSLIKNKELKTEINNKLTDIKSYVDREVAQGIYGVWDNNSLSASHLLFYKCILIYDSKSYQAEIERIVKSNCCSICFDCQ